MALRTLPRWRIGRIYHRLRPYKHVENSPTGVRRARRGGFRSIDIDLQITRDGVIVACHDGQPLRHGFFDPLHRIRRDAKIRELTWAQVSRLRARTGFRLYRIHRIEQILRVCRRYGRVALLEPKADRRFGSDWPWRHIAAAAEAAGTTVSVRALRELDGAAHVAAARRAHIEAWTI
jgi:glycerophosphoryl diester phosphodiesterase